MYTVYDDASSSSKYMYYVAENIFSEASEGIFDQQPGSLTQAVWVPRH